MPIRLDIQDPEMPEHKQAEYLRIYRAIPPERRLQAAFELSGFEKNLLASGVRALYPGISEREVTARLAWLWLPDEQWEKVYGPGASRPKKE